MEARGWYGVFFSTALPRWFFFLSQDLSLASSSAIHISCLAEIPRDPFVPLPRAGMTDTGHRAWLFTWVLGIHLRSSRIHDNTLTHEAISPALSSLKQLGWTQYCQLNKYALTQNCTDIREGRETNPEKAEPTARRWVSARFASLWPQTSMLIFCLAWCKVCSLKIPEPSSTLFISLCMPLNSFPPLPYLSLVPFSSSCHSLLLRFDVLKCPQVFLSVRYVLCWKPGVLGLEHIRDSCDDGFPSTSKVMQYFWGICFLLVGRGIGQDNGKKTCFSSLTREAKDYKGFITFRHP